MPFDCFHRASYASGMQIISFSRPLRSAMPLPCARPRVASYTEGEHSPSTRPTSPTEDGLRCPISWVNTAELAPQEKYLAADGQQYDKEALKAWLLRYDCSPVDLSCSLLGDVPVLWPEDEALTPAQHRRAWLRNFTTTLPRTWDQEIEDDRIELERVLMLCTLAGVGMSAALLGCAVGRLSTEGQGFLESVHRHCMMLFVCGWMVDRGPRLLRRATRWYVAQAPVDQQVRRLTEQERRRRNRSLPQISA